MESTNTLLDREYATDQLDVAERARLQELESIVEHGLQTFYEVGKALDEIRNRNCTGKPTRLLRLIAGRSGA
jgi:hypothetical protein